jgi:hypothetical protein
VCVCVEKYVGVYCNGEGKEARGKSERKDNDALVIIRGVTSPCLFFFF